MPTPLPAAPLGVIASDTAPRTGPSPKPVPEPHKQAPDAPSVEELLRENARLRERCADLEHALRESDARPIAPAHLRVRVGGWEDPDHFLAVGRKIHWDVKRLLDASGRSLAQFRSILDFGCGCGRLLRHLRARPGTRVVGCDIDAESIEWCRANLAGNGIECVHAHVEPPLPFDDAAFDLAIAIS